MAALQQIDDASFFGSFERQRSRTEDTIEDAEGTEAGSDWTESAEDDNQQRTILSKKQVTLLIYRAARQGEGAQITNQRDLRTTYYVVLQRRIPLIRSIRLWSMNPRRVPN